MPYDRNGRYIKPKTDNKTDILGFGEIGGVGQLIYHHIRFKKYETLDSRLPDCIVLPVINKKPLGNRSGGRNDRKRNFDQFM